MSEFLPRSYGGDQPPVTRAGIATATPDGGYTVDLGTLEALNWWWEAEGKTLAVALIAGAQGGVAPPTKITSGLLREDGKEIAGDLSEIVRLVQCAPKAPASSGTQTREEADKAAAKAALRTGIAAILGNALVLTPEGLGNLEAVFTSGGRPRSELDRDAQQGKVPAAIDGMARFATWRVNVGTFAHSLSMPLMLGYGLENPFQPLVPAYGKTSLPLTNEPSKEGDRFEDGVAKRNGGPAGNTVGPNLSEGSIELWGSLDPFDMGTGEALTDDGTKVDPESYQDRARWAPHIFLNPEEVWGDDKPPPRKPPPGGDPPPEPPPEERKPEGEGEDETRPPRPLDPKNPQERNITAPQVALPDGFTGISLPETDEPIGALTEAFTTETGNAVSPHPVTISMADEDDDDAGGIDTDGGAEPVPLTAGCPLEDPSAEEAGTIPTSFPGSGTGTGTGGDGIDRGFGLPPFPLPDLGAGILFL